MYKTILQLPLHAAGATNFSGRPCVGTKFLYICTAQKKIAEVAQLVEHNLAKVGVAGSNPVFRSRSRLRSRAIG